MMETLPSELLVYLSSWLSSTSDLKALRLCSRAHAAAAEGELFRDFEFRMWPSQYRVSQLEQLITNPGIASRLKCLSFESGLLLEYADYRYWQAQVYGRLSSAWMALRNGGITTKEEYAAFHTALQARFLPNMQLKYSSYRWHLDREACLVAQTMSGRLVRAMNALRPYCSSLVFKISMVEPQVALEDVERFDPSLYQYELLGDGDMRARVANRRQNTLKHLTNFLIAAHESELEVTNLLIADMPQELLGYNPNFTGQLLPELFAELQSVNVKLSNLPHSDWISRAGIEYFNYSGRDTPSRTLRRLLERSHRLESLRLEFPREQATEYSFYVFDRFGFSDARRFSRKFLMNLQRLELCHFQCTLEELQALLSTAKSLKHLTLAHCHLQTSSMVDLIHCMPALELDDVSLLGEWSVDQDGGSWHAHIEKDFTDCSGSTTYEGPYLDNGVKRQIEEYMIGGRTTCPLPRWGSVEGVDCPWELLGDTSFHFVSQAPP